MYLLPDDTYAVSAGNAFELSRVEIPASNNGKLVSAIVSNAFKDAPNLTEIIIPKTVSSVGTDAFLGCKITKAKVPACAVDLIPTDMLKSLEIDGGTVIDTALNGCVTLESLTVADGITRIESSAFKDCTALSSIELTNDLTYIAEDTFLGTKYYNTQSKWDGSVLYVGNHLVNVKDSLTGKIEIKEGTKTIAAYAFKDCDSLTGVIVPDSVENINNNAFAGCTRIETIELGKGLKVIGVGAFTDTAYYKNTKNWTDNVLYIGNYLIEAAKDLLGEYVIKDGTTLIAEEAFFKCNKVSSLTIPAEVVYINDKALQECDILASIKVDEDNAVFKSLDDNLYNKQNVLLQYPIGKAATIVEIPDETVKIGDYAFYKCGNIVAINVPENVIEIGEQAFAGCAKLYAVDLPNVKTIDTNAFKDCTVLGEVKFGAVLDLIGESAFEGCIALKTVALPAGLSEISTNAFRDCTGLESIIFPASMRVIGASAFAGTGLKTVTFENAEGWRCSFEKNATNGNVILASSLSDNETAVRYLKNYSFDSLKGYANFYWRCDGINQD